MLAGLLGSRGLLEIYLAYFIIICADMASDTAYYLLGRWGSAKTIKKFSGFAKFGAVKMQRLTNLFKTHPAKTVIISKLTHVAGVPAIITAGGVRIKYFNFFVYSLIATIPKSLVFILIGYYIGEVSGNLSRYLEYSALVIFLLVAVFIIYLLIGNYLKKKLIEKT